MNEGANGVLVLLTMNEGANGVLVLLTMNEGANGVLVLLTMNKGANEVLGVLVLLNTLPGQLPMLTLNYMGCCLYLFMEADFQ